MGLGLPPSKIVCFRGKGSQLGHPLAKLGGHVPVQPCLIDEVVPILLVFVKEPGFLPAASNKRLKKDGGQKTKIDEERRDRKVRPNGYQAGGNDDASKGAAGLVQSFQRVREPLAELIPLHALGGIVEGEEFRRRVPWTHPPEWGLIPHG